MKQPCGFLKLDDDRLKGAISCIAKFDRMEINQAVHEFRMRCGYGHIAPEVARQVLAEILKPLIDNMPSEPFLPKMTGPRTLKQALIERDIPQPDNGITYSTAKNKEK